MRNNLLFILLCVVMGLAGLKFGTWLRVQHNSTQAPSVCFLDGVIFEASVDECERIHAAITRRLAAEKEAAR